jgi:glycosyltransferase involved in cell wall biosynthesis
MTADAVGGVWQYSVDLGRAMVQAGITPTLAVMGPAPTTAQHDEATRAGLQVVHGDYRLEWMPDSSADVERAGRWLLELERTLHPDLVHLNGYAHATLPWSCPVLVVAHSCVRTWWKAVRHESAPAALDQYTAAVRAGLAAATLVIAPTAAMLAALTSEYGVPTRGRVIPNGSPLASTADEEDAPGKEPLIFAAGRVWDEAKNVASLCAIADRLPWPVYVAGDCRGPDGTIRALRSVRLLGRLSMHAMTHWYRRASIYALPARYEPFGLSVLEAACAGCALVLGDIASLRENWDDAAIFVPPDDRDALANALQTLITQPAIRTLLARAARERASAFTIDRTAHAYLQAYDVLAI